MSYITVLVSNICYKYAFTACDSFGESRYTSNVRKLESEVGKLIGKRRSVDKIYSLKELRKNGRITFDLRRIGDVY